MPDETPKTKKRSCLATTCLGCGGLLVLLIGGFAVGSVFAARRLEQRLVLLGVALDDAQSARVPTRPPLFHLGADKGEGNAVDDYAALTWVLGPTPDMTTAPPGAGATGLERDHPKASGVPHLLTPAKGTTVEAMLDAHQPPTPAMAKTLALYGPLAMHVRSGVRRSRCDWSLDLTRGAGVDLPNLAALRSVALYMACEAAGQPPLAAARTGLELVAFGRDVARHDTLIGVMVGIAIQGVGVRTIARALDQGPATKEELAELLAALDHLPPLDLDRALTCERLGMQVELARMSGHPLAPRASQATSATPPVDPAQMAAAARLGPLFYDRELSGYDQAMGELVEVLKRPASERAAAHEAVMARFQYHIFTRIAVPNLATAQDHVERANVEVDLCRLLLAAHLHRLETGQPPARDDELAPRLGGELPRDPFAAPGAPVRWAVADGRLRAWSLGPDLVDDGGQTTVVQDKGDVVLSTPLPPR
jgi:hypothetical protein